MKKYLAIGSVAGVGVIFFAGSYLLSIPEKQKTPAPIQKTEVTTPQVTPICLPHNYKVVAGDSLWKIAESEWGGRAYFWPVLAETNNLSNPNLILVGQVLVIPCLCDLPVLKKPVVKKTTSKKVVKAVVSKPTSSPCPACPKVEVLPTPASVEVVPVQKVTPTEAPKPPPVVAPVQPTPVVVPQPAPVVQPPAPKPPVVVVQPLPPAKPPVEEKIVPPAFQSFHGDEGSVAKQPTPPKAPVPPPAKPPVEEEIVPPQEQSFHGEEGPVAKQPSSPKKPDLVPVTKQNQEHWGHEKTERAAPGSLWDVFGTSPLERGNWINYFHVDQGVLLGKVGKAQIIPYVGLNAVKDTKSYSWNNRVQGEAGVKAVRPFSGGVVEVGTAYAAERRFGKDLSVRTKTGLIGFARGWNGWQLPTVTPPVRRFLPGGLPGTFQWQVGNISPFERNNVIGSLRADQGFTLAKFGRVSLIPTASFQVWADSDKNPWNRRYMYGGGLRVAIPFKSGIVDVQGGYMCAKQYSGTPISGSNGNGCGPAVSVSIWTGWGRSN